MRKTRWCFTVYFSLALVLMAGDRLTFAEVEQGSSNEPPAVKVPTGFKAKDPYRQILEMRRGINIVGYDLIWSDFSKARFQERHFKRIHDGGFQTLRINLQAFEHMDQANHLSSAWLGTLDWVIERGLANHLTVIVDEHDFTRCAEDLAACRGRLLAFWQQVAERYKDAPNSVVFEILNEPNGQVTAEAWNELLREALAIIRKSNPARNVIIGPANWNEISSLKDLRLPPTDHHLIATVHYYAPMRFTHQGASWAKEYSALSGITWGTEDEKRHVNEDLARASAWSSRQHRPILLGEFGAYDKGDMDSRARYTSYVARRAESLGWAWAYWQFDSDFLAYDMATDDWIQPIHRALIP